MTKIELAKQFAHEAHDSIHQVRKYTKEPYWVHTDAVADRVATVPGATDEMVIAAHLHDVEEDVAPYKKVIPAPERYGLPVNSIYYYDIIAIAAIWGALVTRYVLDLTDQFTREAYPTWNRARRKEAERERIGTVPPEVQTIKLCDLVHNTSSICEHDRDFAKTYLKEKLALLPKLANGYPPLLQKASDQVIEYSDKLDLHIMMLYHDVWC